MSVVFTAVRFDTANLGEDLMDANFRTHYFVDTDEGRGITRCLNCGLNITAYASKYVCGSDYEMEWVASTDAEAMSYANVNGVPVRSLQSGEVFGLPA